MGCAHLTNGGILPYEVLISMSYLGPLLILLGRDVGIPTSRLTEDLIHEILGKTGEFGDPVDKYFLSWVGEQLLPSL